MSNALNLMKIKPAKTPTGRIIKHKLGLKPSKNAQIKPARYAKPMTADFSFI
jgi:hypothetical protein